MNISDKETRAMFLNFKERRCLEKNVQSLDIEQAYNISLINLDQKIVKVNQKKLKDRTSRIKTNLSEDEIEEFQRLEMEGNLGVPESASKMDFKIRIAAASKRLKLQPRAKSAVPRLGVNGKLATATPRITPRSARTPRRESVMPQGDDTPTADFPLPRSVREERRQSISINATSAYIESGKDTSKHAVPVIRESNGDTDAKRKNGDVRTDAFARTPKVNVNDSKRRKSVDFSNPVVNNIGSVEQVYVESPRPNRPQNLNIPHDNENAKSMSLLTVPQDSPSPRTVTTRDAKIRPLSVPATHVTDYSKTDTKNRPSTTASHAVNIRKKSAADISRVSRLLASGKTSTSFSSHDNSNKENKTKTVKPFRSIRDSNISSVDTGSLDIKVGEDLYREMKKSMVLGEVANSLILEEKLDYFIDKMDSYIKKDNNSLDQDITPVATVTVVTPAVVAGSAGQGKKPKQKRNVLRRRQLETRLQHEAGNDNGDNDELWKDVNKCRYLRVPEEMIDLTGINTLAKDQLRMFDLMRQTEEESDG